MSKRIIILSIILLSLYLVFPKTISEINMSIPVFTLKHEKRDTLNFIERLNKGDTKLIYFNNWCDRCSKEFESIYQKGIIDSLIKRDVSLILIINADMIKDRDRHLPSEIVKVINENFEIYYEINSSFSKSFAENKRNLSSPYMLLISNGEIIEETIGFQEDYNFLLDKLNRNQYKGCLKCKGTGRVTPNPKFGGPDEAVGICPRCGGSGR